MSDTGVGGFLSGDNEELWFEFAADGVNFVTLERFDGDNGGNMATTNIDAVAEFKVLTNSYAAE